MLNSLYEELFPSFPVKIRTYIIVEMGLNMRATINIMSIAESLVSGEKALGHGDSNSLNMHMRYIKKQIAVPESLTDAIIASASCAFTGSVESMTVNDIANPIKINMFITVRTHLLLS